MISKMVITLIRKKLGLKKYEHFRFANQRSETEYYWFTDDAVLKYCEPSGFVRKSSVSLNWLLNDKCKIVRC